MRQHYSSNSRAIALNSSYKIVLVNLNNYLGGGETLMVRFANYLQERSVDFLCVCASDSYLIDDLHRNNIATSSILPIEASPDYYYSNYSEREKLVDLIISGLGNKRVRIISFCMRDLYIVFAICAKIRDAIPLHLILHMQDDLYLGQTILDKLFYRLSGRRNFGNLKSITFNRRLLNLLNASGGLICMADVIATAWRRNFGIDIPPERIVPLPSFAESSGCMSSAINNYRILWIGRLVDFKIPALLAMIDYLGSNNFYSMTIVGEGDRAQILKRMKDRGVREDRVRFMGEVAYGSLEQIAQGHSIGYAMGTSLVELARFRIPVIIALASYKHRAFKKPICGGLFFDQPRGCDGSELALKSEDQIKTTIEDAIETIESNWVKIGDACYEYARKNYSIEKNFSDYRSIVERANEIPLLNSSIKIPLSPIARKILFIIQNRLAKCMRRV